MPNDVPSDSAVPMDIAEVYSELFPLLKEDGEFIGVVDEAGTTLQMMYQSEDDLYWFEVPCPEKAGAYGMALIFDEAADFLRSLDGLIPREGYPNFSFSSW